MTKHRFIPSLFTTFFCLLSIAIVGCDNGNTNTETQTPTVALGKQVFDANCVKCHGASGEGTSTYAGSIKGATGIRTIVQNGRREMPSFPKITLAEIESMEMYLATLKVDLSQVSGTEYYTAVCAACHGANGEGTTRGYAIKRPVTGYATYVIRNGRAGTPFAEAMPKYATTDVSDKQLSEMLTWLKAFPKPTDGKGLFNMFCANCHGTDGRGGVVGESIRAKNYLAIVRFGNGGSTYSNRGSYMPSWTATEITDAEVALMEQYGRTL